MSFMHNAHYLTVGSFGCHPQLLGKRTLVNYPAMVPSDGKSCGQPHKKRVFPNLHLCSHPMNHLGKVVKVSPKSLPASLMPQTDAQYMFGWRVFFYQSRHYPCIGRQSRTRGEKVLVVFFTFIQMDSGVSNDIHLL